MPFGGEYGIVKGKEIVGGLGGNAVQRRKRWVAVWVLVMMVLGGLGGCGEKRAEIRVQPVTETEYDVIVVGGEPEGVSAAVSAARNGMKTLLVCEEEALGGLMTLGELNFIDMCEGSDGTLLTRGIFKEFYDAV